MTSKEALKKLSNDLGNYSPFQRKINIIKQDLERLEKENKELNRQLDVFFDKLDKNTLRAVDIISYELKDENEKLKKVIKILKDELGLYLEKIKFDRRKIFALMSKLLGMCLLNTTEENYDLLKKVFGNE